MDKNTIPLATFLAAAAKSFDLHRSTHEGSKPDASKKTKRNRMRNKMARESRRRNR